MSKNISSRVLVNKSLMSLLVNYPTLHGFSEKYIGLFAFNFASTKP